MHGNCCKQKIENNKKIKLLVKVYTYVEGPTNCNAATSTTRQCKNNDNNDIKERLVMERLVWSGQYGVVRLVWSGQISAVRLVWLDQCGVTGKGKKGEFRCFNVYVGNLDLAQGVPRER